MDKPKFYITTSIVYANAKPHIGFALELLQADAIARWHRLRGEDVYFLTGTDEHGTKVYETAKAAGQAPQVFVDANATAVQNLIERLNISNTDFIRTTDQRRHWPTAQKVWQELAAKDAVYQGHYHGLYSLTDEAYITPTEAKSPAYADKKVIELEEDNYLFRLQGEEAAARSAIETIDIQPAHRAREMLNFIGSGLRDVSFSRPKDKLPWGVSVPGDESQVMYVWCDALTNYISALGYAEGADAFKKYWPADVQVVGKDILRFHSVIWPMMLRRVGLALPKRMLVHGHILVEGNKMGKSTGNVVDPIELIDQWGTDAVRYYLLKEIPTMDDGDYSPARFEEVYNADLANDLGNLLSRVLKLADGRVAASPPPEPQMADFWTGYASEFSALALDKTLIHVGALVRGLNRWIDARKPWELIKTDADQAAAVVSGLLESLRHISIALYPFLPETSDRIRRQLGLAPIDPDNFDLSTETQWGGLPAGHQLGQSEILFPKPN